jgi:hypothetical protein
MVRTSIHCTHFCVEYTCVLCPLRPICRRKPPRRRRAHQINLTRMQRGSAAVEMS